MNPAIQNTTPVLMEGGAVRWHGLFAPAALDALEQARLNSGASSIRATRVAWVHRNAGTEALYRDMEATPVTRGRRKVLVVWAAGPEFR